MTATLRTELFVNRRCQRCRHCWGLDLFPRYSGPYRSAVFLGPVTFCRKETSCSGEHVEPWFSCSGEPGQIKRAPHVFNLTTYLSNIVLGEMASDCRNKNSKRWSTRTMQQFDREQFRIYLLVAGRRRHAASSGNGAYYARASMTPDSVIRIEPYLNRVSEPCWSTCNARLEPRSH